MFLKEGLVEQGLWSVWAYGLSLGFLTGVIRRPRRLPGFGDEEFIKLRFQGDPSVRRNQHP